jgi:hypothetical protein
MRASWRGGRGWIRNCCRRSGTEEKPPQVDLGVIRARAEVVERRTALINSVRGLVKPLGERLKKCDAEMRSAR